MKANYVTLAISCAALLAGGAVLAIPASAPADTGSCPAGHHLETLLGKPTCMPNAGTLRTVTIVNKAGLVARADIGAVTGASTVAAAFGSKKIAVDQSYQQNVSSSIIVWVQVDYWNTKHSDWESVPKCRAEVQPGSSSITFTARGTSDGEQAGTSMTMHCDLG